MNEKKSLDSLQDLDDAVLSNLKILQEHDANILQDLISIFETNVPPQIEDLIKSIRENKKDRIVYLSHTLKSSTGTLGMMKLNRLFTLWEEQAKNSSFETFFGDQNKEELIKELQLHFSKAREKILKLKSA